MGLEGEGEKVKKAHKKRAAGVKAKKKKDKAGFVEKHNPRAFTFSGGAKRLQKNAQYKADQATKREHAPIVDKTGEIPPPLVVVVQGPPGVGKSTLVRSLVRYFSKQKLITMRGPVTLVSGKNRRLTIIECTQDVRVMLDLAKVADLVLCLVDASYGFELETFEFINIMQVHGFPRILGVMTHLDQFRENKQMKKMKKTLKHRFWQETHDGAKMFHLSGMLHGRYPDREIINLARFISCARAPTLKWRQSHPYMLALRWEDQTPPTVAAHEPRMLDLYGYVYGGRVREGTQVHLAGVGDFQVAKMRQLPDPCPPPKESEATHRKNKTEMVHGSLRAEPKRENRLRTLADRHRIVYAPGSDVGTISMDTDTLYITLPKHDVGFTERDGEVGDVPEAVRLVREMQQGQHSLDLAGKQPNLRLTESTSVRAVEESAERIRRPVHFEDEDELNDKAQDPDGSSSGEEPGSDDDGFREALEAQASARWEKQTKLEDAVYGKVTDTSAGSKLESTGEAAPATDHATIPLFEGDDAKNDGDNLPVSKLFGNMGDTHALDTTRMPLLPGQATPWDTERIEDLKSRKFITGGWSSEEEGSGDEKEKDATAEAGDGEGKSDKPKKKDAVENVDLSEFTDGAPIGAFVRIRLEGLPAACVAELRSERPIVLGGLASGETGMCEVQSKVKRHRWNPKLLKSNDAMLLSCGWRRFQTVPTFSIEDRGEKRMRYLKYSLEHMHCHMTYYGPLTPPGAGIMAFRSWNKTAHFRTSASGQVLESAPNFEVKKKLKLVGEPYKIFKNTAFIRNMFNSDIEVNRYMGAKIQTVSGIRGEIKKAEGVKGWFRGAFEDRILMSDIVVCKCWINVTPKKFYLPAIDIASWRPARTIGELRAAEGVPVPNKPDSAYGAQVVRPPRKFNPLQVPQSLQKELPFKLKAMNKKKHKNEMRKKTVIVPTAQDKEVNSMLTRLYKVKAEKKRIRDEASAKKKTTKEKQGAFIKELREEHNKENRKKRHIKEGNAEKAKRKAMRMET